MTVGLLSNSAGLFQPFVAEELGVTRARVALFQTIQSLASVAGLMAANRLIDKLPLRAIMSAGVIAIGGCLMLNSLFTNLYLYYISFAVIGFCLPFLSAFAVTAMLTNWFRQRLGTVMGIAVSMTGIGGAVLNPLTAWAIGAYGWRTSYFAAGVMYIVLLLPMALFLFRLKPRDTERPYGYIPDDILAQGEADGIPVHRARKMPSYYLYFAAMAFLAIPGGFMQQISPHVVTLGHTVTTGATVMSGVMLGIAAGKVVIGWLLDRYRASMVTIGFGVAGILGWLGLTAFTRPVFLIFCGFLAGAAHGISQVGIPVGVQVTFGALDYRRIYAVIASAMSLVGAAMPALGSLIYDLTGSYVTPLTVTAFSYTAAVPCVLLAARLGRTKE